MLALVYAVTVITVPVSILAYISGAVMPLVTGFVTHLNAPSPVKAVLNLALSLAAGVVAAFIAHTGTLTVGEIITAAVQAYLASGVAYIAFWKPTGIAPAVNSSGLSLGAPTNPPTE